MKERPIIFQAESVRAILEGRKTMTRRTAGLTAINQRTDTWRYDGINVNGDHLFFDVFARVSDWDVQDCTSIAKCPYGVPGDRLWVRETWAPSFHGQDCLYRADPWVGPFPFTGQWKSPIHMPRWASRITLEIVQVRVERVQNISSSDCIAEGVETLPDYQEFMRECSATGGKPDLVPRSVFAGQWQRINAKRGYGWDVNPWVWVIEFKRMHPTVGEEASER